VDQITNVSYETSPGVWSAQPPQGYDNTGNRTGLGNTPIAGNRMSTAAGETLSYDANWCRQICMVKLNTPVVLRVGKSCSQDKENTNSRSAMYD